VSAPAERMGSAPEPFPPPRAAQGEARALLVEDEWVVGELLAEFLTLEGYEVDRAMDGREALELVRHRAYALIVSDVRMPDVDGPALYYELRVVCPEVARRMVFVTGDIMSSETRRFLDETCLRYLEKPFTIAEFRAVVRGVLAEPSNPGQPAPGAAPS
jgi:DNA-binding response OmpR family regulator